MEAVYSSAIEIFVDGITELGSSEHERRRKVEQLKSMRAKYETGTHERALLDFLWNRGNQEPLEGRTGYIGNCKNCTFPVLFEIFAIDLIAFLFDKPWIPAIRILDFNADDFLSRVAILEEAAAKLREGDTLSVSLPQSCPYLRIESSPALFNVERHGIFLHESLRELRHFGELGQSLRARHPRVPVQINICSSYSLPADVMKHATFRVKAAGLRDDIRGYVATNGPAIAAALGVPKPLRKCVFRFASRRELSAKGLRSHKLFNILVYAIKDQNGDYHLVTTDFSGTEANRDYEHFTKDLRRNYWSFEPFVPVTVYTCAGPEILEFIVTKDDVNLLVESAKVVWAHGRMASYHLQQWSPGILLDNTPAYFGDNIDFQWFPRPRPRGRRKCIRKPATAYRGDWFAGQHRRGSNTAERA